MAKSNNQNSPDSLNKIVSGTEITGEVKSNSNFRIDGKVNGKVHVEGKLVIGSTGLIEGEVYCENAEVEGKVEGVLKVKEFLSLKSTAVINGEMYSTKLAIEPGANFSGKCDMSGNFSSSSKKTEE